MFGVLFSQDTVVKVGESASTVVEAASGETLSRMDQIVGYLQQHGVSIGLKILGAIVLWIVGGILIGMVKKLVARGIDKSSLDVTIKNFALSMVGFFLKLVLIMAILEVFGVKTTSFAAIIAAVGVGIGMAWSGLLANFAAGIFLLILRPFKVGDFVMVGGVVGTVKEIGLFVTKIDAMDNVLNIVGNNKIFSENMQNFTTNEFRRVDLVAQLAHGADHGKAIQILKAALKQIPNTLEEPSVEILEFNLAGPVLAVRPFCHNDHYWDVYFATNKAIRDELGKAGFAVPETHYNINKAA